MNNALIGEQVGIVSIHMYKEPKTGFPFFYIDAENKDVLHLSHIIENTLENY